jgi:hypothetical protein
VREGFVLIENEGAIFRGPSRGLPAEVLIKGQWKPYRGGAKDVAWGDIVTPERAAEFVGGPIPD